jgi:mannose-6-phosphate isomerase-like protein (cupin superfamily)
MKSGLWQPENVLNQIAQLAKEEEPYLEPFSHGTMSLGMYVPSETDPQEPHDQDELYFVHSGSGVLFHGDDKTEFKPGDAIFVAAGVEHRFEDFTEDFSAWVVFWGVKGGEVNEI